MSSLRPARLTLSVSFEAVKELLECCTIRTFSKDDEAGLRKLLEGRWLLPCKKRSMPFFVRESTDEADGQRTMERRPLQGDPAERAAYRCHFAMRGGHGRAGHPHGSGGHARPFETATTAAKERRTKAIGDSIGSEKPGVCRTRCGRWRSGESATCGVLTRHRYRLYSPWAWTMSACVE